MELGRIYKVEDKQEPDEWFYAVLTEIWCETNCANRENRDFSYLKDNPQDLDAIIKADPWSMTRFRYVPREYYDKKHYKITRTPHETTDPSIIGDIGRKAKRLLDWYKTLYRVPMSLITPLEKQIAKAKAIGTPGL